MRKIDWKVMRKRIDWKDIGRRAGKTFIQAFAAAVVVSPEQISAIKDWESARATLAPVLIGGLAAGVSAVWNCLTGRYETFDAIKEDGLWRNLLERRWLRQGK